MEKKGNKKTLIVFAAIFVFLLLGELLIDNYLSVACFFGGCGKKEIAISDISLVNARDSGGYIDAGSSSTLSFDCGGADVRCVYIEYADGYAYSDEARIFESELLYEVTKVTGKTYSAGSVECCNGYDFVLPIRAGDGIVRMTVKLGSCVSYPISSVTLNYAGGFSFSYVRFGLITLLLIIIYYIVTRRLYLIVFRRDSVNQRIVFGLLAFLLVLCSAFVCYVSIKGDLLYEYPLEGSVDDYGCYPQMFDAFRKGQLNIDTDYDLSIFSALENPYDRVERDKAAGETFGVFWDRAFYNGKLYSYFGIAPVIFIYYPVYFLTGMVPSDALTCTILASFTCVFMMLLLWELCRRYTKGVPFLLLLLGSLALPFGSLVYSSQTCANFYHIAVMSGICCTVMFLWFVLRACASEKGFVRKLLFSLAGVFAAAIVASRPNMALYIFIALPILISVIAKRERGTKSLVTDIVSFCAPMLALGGLLMAYNYARFGSVFEFGSNYQLTLTDVSTYNASLIMLLPTLFHYYFQLPSLNGVFPYLHPSVSGLGIYRSWTYLYPTIGAAFIPATWGNTMILPHTRGDKVKRATLIIAIAATFGVAFVDMCFGGVHLRYAADIMFILVPVGVLMLLQWVGERMSSGRSFGYAYIAVIVLLVLTVAVDIPLCLDNERDMIMKCSTEFYYRLMS